MNKKEIAAILLLLMVSIGALFPRYLVLDGNSPIISVDTFNDVASGGNSKVLELRDSMECNIKYFVGSDHEFPYVGVGFFVTDSQELIDLSSYQKMIIEVDPQKSDKFNCQMAFFLPGFSSMEDGTTQQVLLTPVLVKPDQQKYEYNFKRLPTPQWWYQTNHISEDSVPPFSFKNFSGISFSNHPLFPRNKEYQIAVKKVIFKKRNYRLAVFSLILSILYGFFILIRYSRKKVETFVPYKPVTLSDVSNEEERLLSYIGEMYTSIGLNLAQVTEETGLSEKKIRAILKDKMNSSFKQYLNQLRISEAVRLIKETDNPISEIALSVGYKHISTFNTVFKSLYGKSPTHLR